MSDNWPNLSGKTILQVIPDLAAGGAERTTVEMAQAITGAGGIALVASTGGRLEDALKAAGGELIAMNMATKNPLAVRANTTKLVKLIKSRGIDVIHARSRAPGWSAYMAAQRTDTPFVTTYHGAYSGTSGLKRKYNSVMAKGELVIANSEWTAAHVHAVHGTPKDKVVTIPRGVDFATFDPAKVSAERQAALAKSWGLELGGTRLNLVLPGRLTDWKGQRVAIEAMALLDGDERARLHLILPGDDQGRSKYVAELTDAIEAHGLTANVSLTGHCEDMPAAYALADIVLAPSKRPEAFGRVAAEASAMGKPVIVADHGGQREIVVEGQTGIRVEPGSASALAAAIRTLINLRPEARSAMGEAGRDHVSTRFSKKQLQTATLNVYARVLGLTEEVES
ncbi:MAG: glycosyltransferase family 4 protein [Pseudomonadota bacterium]